MPELRRKNFGGALVEILLATALVGLLIPAVVAGLLTTREGRAQRLQRLRAAALATEVHDIMRVVRERDWNLIATNGTYSPIILSNSWALTAGPETIDNFTRTVEISNAYRDALGNLSDSGTIDPSTKRIETTVSWTSPQAASVVDIFYLTRYLDNLAFTETTLADFSAGEFVNTVAIENEDGEVILGAGGLGDWCNSFDNTVATLDLPKNGQALAISAMEGQVIAGTGANASGVSLAQIDISNDNPPIVQIINDLDGYKTNDVFGETNYSYLATDTNNAEVVIADMTTNPMTAVGSVDLPGIEDATGVSVSGSVGYAVSGSTMWNFDLSGKAGTRPMIDGDGVSLAGTASEIVVVGNYAYVPVSGSSVELQIIDVSNTSNMTVVGQADVSGTNGVDVFVNSTGTRAYLVTETSGNPEFFIIDVTAKTGDQTIVSSFETNGMSPKAVVVVTGNRAIIGGHGGEEYQIIDITNENSLTQCGGFNLDVGINDIDSVLEADGDAYSYVLTRDSSSELRVIQGGPGGTFSENGTFTSAIFDATFSTVFNRFDVDETTPVGTTLEYQIAASDPSPDCASAAYTFVGPDGTDSTFFSGSDAIPIDDDGTGYENPAQCFRYRAYLDTESSSQSPSFEQITVNYSP